MDVKGKVPRRWEDIAAKKKSGTSLNLVQGVSRHLRGKRLADWFTNASGVNDGHVLLSDLHILYVILCTFVYLTAYLTVFVLLCSEKNVNSFYKSSTFHN